MTRMNTHILVKRESPTANRGKAMMVDKPDFDGDWHGRYFAGSGWETVDAYRVYEETGTDPPIPYHWELAGPGGASFLLFIPPGTSREAIANAKAWLRNARDVVYLSTFRITEWLHEPQPPHRHTVVTYADLVEWLEYHKIDAAQAVHAIHLASETIGVLYRDLETQRFNTPEGNTWPSRSGADTIEMLSLLYERFTPDENAERHALSIEEP